MTKVESHMENLQKCNSNLYGIRSGLAVLDALDKSLTERFINSMDSCMDNVKIRIQNAKGSVAWGVTTGGLNSTEIAELAKLNPNDCKVLLECAVSTNLKIMNELDQIPPNKFSLGQKIISLKKGFDRDKAELTDKVSSLKEEKTTLSNHVNDLTQENKALCKALDEGSMALLVTNHPCASSISSYSALIYDDQTAYNASSYQLIA